MEQGIYERDGAGWRCKRHNVWFKATGGCEACALNPGPRITVVVDEPLPAPPAGCDSTETIERQLTAEAELVRTTARRYATKKCRTRIGGSTAAKLWDTWTKMMRLKHDLAARREDEVIVQRRDQLEADRDARKGN